MHLVGGGKLGMTFVDGDGGTCVGRVKAGSCATGVHEGALVVSVCAGVEAGVVSCLSSDGLAGSAAVSSALSGGDVCLGAGKRVVQASLTSALQGVSGESSGVLVVLWSGSGDVSPSVLAACGVTGVGASSPAVSAAAAPVSASAPVAASAPAPVAVSAPAGSSSGSVSGSGSGSLLGGGLFGVGSAGSSGALSVGSGSLFASSSAAGPAVSSGGALSGGSLFGGAVVGLGSSPAPAPVPAVTPAASGDDVVVSSSGGSGASSSVVYAGGEGGSARCRVCAVSASLTCR